MKYNFDEIIDRTGTYSLKNDLVPEGTRADNLRMSVADMEFSCAEPILTALHQRIDRKIFGYTSYNNDLLKSAVTGWFRRRYQWEIEKDDIFFSPGVVAAFAFLSSILAQEGDGIIIQSPVYYPFGTKIEGNGRKAVRNPLVYKNGEYHMDYEDLEKKLADPKNKGVLFCSPHNPVGRVWTEEELRKLVDLCKKYDKWIISDEIHCDLTRNGVQHHPLLKVAPDYKDRIVVCTAPSKTFNLAGMQLSNIIIPNKEYQKKWMEFTDERFSLSICNPLALTAVAAAYNECEDWLDELKTYLDGNIAYAKKFIEENLPKAHVVDTQGTYLVWIDLNAYCSDPKKLEEIMLKKAGLILDEGYIFGKEGNGFERINVACSRSVLVDCMSRLKNALGE